MKVSELERVNGMLPAFAWPGGYPIFYLDHAASELCAECATASLDDPDEVPQNKPAAFEVFYEGEPIHCAQCGVMIESAYDSGQLNATQLPDDPNN